MALYSRTQSTDEGSKNSFENLEKGISYINVQNCAGKPKS